MLKAVSLPSCRKYFYLSKNAFMQTLDLVSINLFKNLVNVNLFVSIGILLICAMTGKIGSVVFASLLFIGTLITFLLANWYEVWTLEASKKVAYTWLGLIAGLTLFANSYALVIGIVIDFIVADMLFNRIVSRHRKKPKLKPMFVISILFVVVFVDAVFNIVNPDIHLYSRSVEMVIYLFLIVKVLLASVALFTENARMVSQRFKEELFIDYSAEFNNFFSHFINTPLTTALSNIEIVRMKIRRAHPEALNDDILKHFKRIDEGLSNVSKTTRELAHIHYIRSEVLRVGSELLNIKDHVCKLAQEYEADFELVIDHWPQVYVPLPMFNYTLGHIFTNAKCYGEKHQAPRLVVHVQDDALVLSVFNKGNIPELGSDILHPFKRGVNTLEGTGIGLGLSLVNDLVEDHRCQFSLENVGAYTRCQLKLPLLPPS